MLPQGITLKFSVFQAVGYLMLWTVAHSSLIDLPSQDFLFHSGCHIDRNTHSSKCMRTALKFPAGVTKKDAMSLDVLYA